MERKDKYIHAFLFILLAAMTCVPAHAADLPTTIWMIAPEIQLDLSTPDVPYGDNQTIQVTLYNPNDYAATGNLSMKIGYRTESGPYEYLSENMLESNLEIVPGANETLLFIYNWSSLGHAEGTYKAYLRFDYNGTYTTRYKTFDVVPTGEDNDTEDDDDDGEQDGEERLEIISMQDFLDFGTVSIIGIRYDSGPYEHGKLRIIGYVSGPKKASRDLDGKTIYMNLCETDTGVELRGVRSNSRFYLNIPLMLKDNCDSTYPLGDYEITARVCAYEEGRWIYYKDNKLKMKTTVRLDANDKCPDSEPTDRDATICEKQSIYNGLIENTCTDTQKDEITGDETKTRVYEVLEFDENIYSGTAFITKIRVYNNSSEKQKGTIYSYVYDNKTLISDGFNGRAWSHNWNANKATFELMPYSNTTIDLMNKVDNAPERLYSFKVRLFFSGKKYDIARKVAVLDRIDEGRLSLNCSVSGMLATARITNLDSSDMNISYYVFGGDKHISGDFKLKKKSEKSIDFHIKDYEGRKVIIDNGWDLYKCYVSLEKSEDQENATVENHITGDVLSQRRPEKKIGFIEWILGLFGL